LETVWSCVLTFLWWGRLHREKKDWEREKENVLHHLTQAHHREKKY
jgi:hypothetical protein